VKFKRSLLAAARSVSRAALKSVRAGELFRRGVSRSWAKLVVQGRPYDLSRFRRVYLAAIGKSAPDLAGRAAALLGDRLEAGVVVCPPGAEIRLPGVACLAASHPLPDDRSVRAARALLRLARRAGEGDLLLVLLSGGGSAMACLPAPGLRLADKRRITSALLRAGAGIRELNAVRKHLSGIKGGRLAGAAYPASVLNLVVSDVIGNDLGVIASGPAHWDASTFRTARRVLERRGLWGGAPARVRAAIEEGLSGGRPETLRRSHPAFRRVRTHILGDNLTALRAAAERASRLGFETRILDAADSGEARAAAARYARLLEKRIARRRDGRPLCFLAGGELTVTVRGGGRGGRNMEFCLAFLGEWSRRPGPWLVLSLGTDGRDGPTDAAGAWVAPSLVRRAERLGLDPAAFLRDNDSYGFFKRAGGLVKTGPTGVNVMDLRIFLFGQAVRPAAHHTPGRRRRRVFAAYSA
jgi:glycerate-2-kinase